MTSFNDLPAEIITEIFVYLSRKDRLACSNVCSLWNGAVNSPYLWRSIVVYLDSDLTDSSTTLVTRTYHQFFKAMEFCWSNPRLPARWMQHDLKEFSKRACQYIMLLQNSYIQLNSIKIVDWYEVPYLKKIIYHLCKFLRSQLHLVRVSFFNTNFYKPECVKLLSACLTTINTIHYLDISNCHHPNPVFYDPVPMKPCFDHLHCLQILKVDYTAFSSGLMDALLVHKNTSLKRIDMMVRENDYLQSLISDQAWTSLHKQCPSLKVAIHIKNRCHFEDISQLFQETMPLTAFTLTCGKIWDQTRSREFRSTLSLVIKNYHKILERVYLQINYNREILDELLITLLNKCVNLQFLEFHGIIKSIDLLRQICRIQTEKPNNSNDFKYFCIVPKDMNFENHYLFTQLNHDFANKFRDRNIDFSINNFSNKNLVFSMEYITSPTVWSLLSHLKLNNVGEVSSTQGNRKVLLENNVRRAEPYSKEIVKFNLEFGIEYITTSPHCCGWISVENWITFEEDVASAQRKSNYFLSNLSAVLHNLYPYFVVISLSKRPSIGVGFVEKERFILLFDVSAAGLCCLPSKRFKDVVPEKQHRTKKELYFYALRKTAQTSCRNIDNRINRSFSTNLTPIEGQMPSPLSPN
ncbi:hypothetical protein FQR65_LT00064 [Abscondita terminalis]|nr:hypothetical protein FQR65_LT00064 [Abscondita terminalis]